MAESSKWNVSDKADLLLYIHKLLRGFLVMIYSKCTYWIF